MMQPYNLTLSETQLKTVEVSAPSARRYDYMVLLEAELKLVGKSSPSDALLANCIQAALQRLQA